MRLYKSNGYDGIVVTDHFLNGNTTVNRGLPWEKQIEEFFRGYEQVEKEGRKEGLKVFFGLEYSYLGTDFLTYGLTQKWLKAHTDLLDLSVKEYLARMREEGALTVQAHPYREADYIDHIRLFPSDVGGSDLHTASQPLLSGVETEEEVFDLAGLIGCIRAGKAVPFLTENQFR